MCSVDFVSVAQRITFVYGKAKATEDGRFAKTYARAAASGMTLPSSMLPGRGGSVPGLSHQPLNPAGCELRRTPYPVRELPLRGCYNMALYRKVLQESPDLGATHASGMTHAIETNEVAYPVAVGFYGARAVASHLHGGLHAIHELWRSAVRVHKLLLAFPVAGFMYSIIGSSKTRKRANTA